MLSSLRDDMIKMSKIKIKKKSRLMYIIESELNSKRTHMQNKISIKTSEQHAAIDVHVF
jgi:hypothetical protein